MLMCRVRTIGAGGVGEGTVILGLRKNGEWAKSILDIRKNMNKVNENA